MSITVDETLKVLSQAHQYFTDPNQPKAQDSIGILEERSKKVDAILCAYIVFYYYEGLSRSSLVNIPCVLETIEYLNDELATVLSDYHPMPLPAIPTDPLDFAALEEATLITLDREDVNQNRLIEAIEKLFNAMLLEHPVPAPVPSGPTAEQVIFKLNQTNEYFQQQLNQNPSETNYDNRAYAYMFHQFLTLHLLIFGQYNKNTVIVKEMSSIVPGENKLALYKLAEYVERVEKAFPVIAQYDGKKIPTIPLHQMNQEGKIYLKERTNAFARQVANIPHKEEELFTLRQFQTMIKLLSPFPKQEQVPPLRFTACLKSTLGMDYQKPTPS